MDKKLFVSTTGLIVAALVGETFLYHEQQPHIEPSGIAVVAQPTVQTTNNASMTFGTNSA
jgi:hypothetical protein